MQAGNSNKPDTKEQLKLEIAEEIGLLEKVRQVGWGGLNAAETGKIGGIMNRYLQKSKMR